MSIPEYMPIGHLLAVGVMSAFYGIVIGFRMIWGVVVHGPKKYFYFKNRTTRPEVLDDPALGTHCYARMKGIRLHYVVNGPKDAPLMLFVHGFPEFWYSWRYQLKEFSNDYRTVAFDMRGYGESEKPQTIPEYRMEKLTDDVKNLINHLGYQSCILVCHDWGGLVAWNFAAKYPDMVDKFVVCDSAHITALMKYARTHLSQLLKSWYMYFFQIPYIPEIFLKARDALFLKQVLTGKGSGGMKPKNFSEDDLDAFVYAYNDYAGVNGPLNYYRAFLRYKPENLPCDRVKCPTLIVWGAEDFFLDKAVAEACREYIDNDCYVSIVDKASHWVQQDEPEVVNHRIREFLSKYYIS